MGFYNASEWRTAWDLEKSLLWLHPQPFYFCFKKDTQNSQRSRLLAGILSRFCQSISPNPPEMHSSHKHHVPPGTVSNSIPYMPKTTTSQSRPHTREDSGPAFSTAYAHLTISWSCLRKLDMKYAQTLIKSKCTMSVTESVCQIAKHLHLCKCFEIHIRIWI